MVSLLSFCTGLLLGMIVAASILAWFFCETWQDNITKMECVTTDATEALEKLYDALENGTLTINTDSKD